MTPFRALDHVIVAVRDLEAATDHYAALLGRAPSWRGSHPEYATRNSLFQLANTYLELLAPARSESLGAQLEARLESHGEGLLGFALATDDADACARELRQRGIPVPDPGSGEGRDAGGAIRRWRNVFLPVETTRGLLVFGIEHEAGSALEIAPLQAEEEAAVAAMDHTVILSQDLEATRRLYGERLGIRLALDRTFPQWGQRLLFFRLGDLTLEVAGSPEAEPVPEAEDRLWGVSWRVPDVDAAQRRLARQGLDVSEVRKGRRPGTRVCTVRADTHGVATLLIEPPA